MKCFQNIVLSKILVLFSTFFQAIRLSLEQALPPEPDEESGEQISKLRIRTPSGEFLERRFLGSCKLQVLFDFVASKGYPFEEFKLLTTFPRRNVSRMSYTLTDTNAHAWNWKTDPSHPLKWTGKDFLPRMGVKLSCCPVDWDLCCT